MPKAYPENKQRRYDRSSSFGVKTWCYGIPNSRFRRRHHCSGGGFKRRNLFVSTTGHADYTGTIDVFFRDELENDQQNDTDITFHQMLVRGDVMRGKFRNSS
jgi:hypothetical protein